MTLGGDVQLVSITTDSVTLPGNLGIPAGGQGIVIFAHGSGSSRLSTRNTYVAQVLRREGIATLLFDLLTAEEDRDPERRFDINLLTQRLVQTTYWVQRQPECAGLPIGYFGASTGSAAALNAAAELGPLVQAVVSRGGRPDLAMDALPRVQAPTLLIIGGADYGVIELNQQAYEQLSGEKQLVLVPGATHLFEEAHALEAVARLAADWFCRFLGGQSLDMAA
ncbi:MAG TPA: alpha/beta family hydrolase [Armatimonadota bacterium]|jgi:dienelactone hydrolase